MFNFNNQPSLFDYLIDKIENEWQPDWSMKEEREFRDDLIRFLNRKLSRSHIIRPEDGRGLADIGIDRKIGIELKLNLHSKSQIDRLIGQMQEYLQDYDEVIVLLLGRVSPTVVREVEHRISQLVEREEEANPLFGNLFESRTKTVKVIVKWPGKPKAKKPRSDNKEDDSIASIFKNIQSRLEDLGF